jgi:hypothetical protein
MGDSTRMIGVWADPAVRHVAQNVVHNMVNNPDMELHVDDIVTHYPEG